MHKRKQKFTGTAYLSPMINNDEIYHFPQTDNVTFDPGARSGWHSHGGSRFSGTIDTIKRLQPGATVITDGYTISRNDVGNAESSLGEWLTGSGY